MTEARDIEAAVKRLVRTSTGASSYIHDHVRDSDVLKIIADWRAKKVRIAELEAALRGLIKCLEGEFDGAKLAEATNRAFAVLAQPAESGAKVGLPMPKYEYQTLNYSSGGTVTQAGGFWAREQEKEARETKAIEDALTAQREQSAAKSDEEAAQPAQDVPFKEQSIALVRYAHWALSGAGDCVEPWCKIAAAFTQARAEGHAAGMEDAAKIADGVAVSHSGMGPIEMRRKIVAAIREAKP